MWWFSIVSSFFLRLKKSHSPFALSFANYSFSLLLSWVPLISQNIGCLIKTPLNNSTQTIFQGGSPWATLIFNSMFVVVVLYCVQLFYEYIFFPNPFLLSFSFPLVILSYFLISILLDFSKCLISQNIWCIIKTPLKNSTQTIFQGGSPWAALIFNCMFVVVVLYCVKFFWVFFQNPFILSCSFPLVVISYFLISILLDFSKCLISQNIGFFLLK